MSASVHTFHHALWKQLSVSEIGISDRIPDEKLLGPSDHDQQQTNYRQIPTTFLDYGEHKLKYIWGDGISALWEDNWQRTCYYPWDKRSFVWNSAKFDKPTSVNKLVITSSANQARNLGLKIQVSANNTDWRTLYEISSLDTQKMYSSPLELYFYDNTEYLYIRVAKDNTSNGYDIESIKVFTYNQPTEIAAAQNSLYYILNGAMTINGMRYRAPFGFLKTYQSTYTITNPKPEKTDVVWISFRGDQAIRLLEESNFDLTPAVFTLKSQSYIQCINHLIDAANEIREENQFQLLSLLMNILAIHTVQNERKAELQSKQNEYVIQALNYIEANKYQPIALSDISRECAISEKYLIKVFKDQLGTSPIHYMNKLKLQKAKKQLRTTNASISQISEELNFCSPEYFCRFFKKEEKCSPSQYRKKSHRSQ